MAEAFGRYTLLDRFAVGSMAELFRAQQLGDARIVMVKRVTASGMGDDELVRQLYDALWIGRLLRHRNIVAVYDLGVESGRHYSAREYVSGLSLRTVARAARKGAPIPHALAAFIAQQVADALAYAHAFTDRDGVAYNLVHRDVSQDNVLLSWSGDVKVRDFAVANPTRSSRGLGTMKGNFRYCSPEQIRGRGLDGRSDQFALGTVLWELCTNTDGFVADSEFEVLERIRDARIARCSEVNPTIPAPLAHVVTRMLAVAPDDRFASATEVSRALKDVLAKELGGAGREQLSSWLRATFPDEHAHEAALLAQYEAAKPASPEPTSHEPLLEQIIAAFGKRS